MGCTYPIPTLAKLFHLVRASSGNMRTQVVKELNYPPPQDPCWEGIADYSQGREVPVSAAKVCSCMLLLCVVCVSGWSARGARSQQHLPDTLRGSPTCLGQRP